MHYRYRFLTISILFFLLIVATAGCKRATPTAPPILILTRSPGKTGEVYTPIKTSVPTQQPGTPAIPQITAGAYPQPTQPISAPQTQIPYPQPSKPTASPTSKSPEPQNTTTQTPTLSPTVSQVQSQPSATPTATTTSVPEYPGPESTSTFPAYPGPGTQVTSTQAVYPGPGTATPKPSRTPSKSATPTTQPSGTIFPSPTLRTGTPGATPTELPPRRPLSPPPAGSNVTIWHAWGSSETDVLKSIIQSFQRLYTDVTFNLLYVPLDDLFTTYQEAAYLEQGPSLLLGPAQWGPELFDGDLIIDLTPYVPAEFLSNVNPAALASGMYFKSLISLPLSQHGVVMFRNSGLISSAPRTFDDLTELSHKATHAGVVGSYLERGSNFSAADVLGLGGKLMDEDDAPLFADPTGLEWIELLRSYDDAGAVTFNTNRDLDMFKRGRVGIIIDGTWNIDVLTEAIGSDKLAIDPWPAYGSGHLSGWVESDSVFLNANTAGNDRFAALAFMGYLLDSNVQMRLAEVGHIPSVTTTKPRDPLIQQAMDAFSYGVPYPITVDPSILSLYWKALDTALRNVFVSGSDPAESLSAASEEITISLQNRQTVP